ncbi:MAG: phosphoribosylformylglycinamidine synthase, partial [Chitinophagaceae bacterium]|nr:phosphoribosylformylglycinamidine synthase [Rubrivivax sp.]
MSALPTPASCFEGGNALSAFRAQALLARLQAVCPRIAAVSARFVHWVDFPGPPARAELDRLQALLTYGEACTGTPAGQLVLVMPRLGTVSPWASKASDIARNCGVGAPDLERGLSGLRRIERVTEYRLAVKPGLLGAGRPLSGEERQAVAALLHDRMTESVAFEHEAAAHLFDARTAPPVAHVDTLGCGRDALVRADAEFGLALSDDEVDYLVDAFGT